MSYRFALLLPVLCVFLCLSGCTTKTLPSATALPELTFEHYPVQYFEVMEVRIENEYSPGIPPEDVSTQFPSAPDIAIRRYAESRLKETYGVTPAASELVVIIENASIAYEMEKSGEAFKQWMGVDGTDIYSAQIGLRVYSVDMDGYQSDHSVLTFKRDMRIPAHYSVARRELEQFKLVELLVSDVDAALNDLWAAKFSTLLDRQL